jgi:hypothetical protein
VIEISIRMQKNKHNNKEEFIENKNLY